MKPILTSLTLALALSSHAATINWTNTSGGNWSVAANWSPNQVPGASDTAYLTNSGTYAVTNNGTRSIGGLVVGGDSGIQTLAQVANYTLTLGGPGRIGANGRFLWSIGTVAGTSALVVAPGGQITMFGTSTKTLSGVITNGGTLAWTGTGTFALGATAVLHNLATGLLDIQNDEILDYSSGSPLVVNDGMIRKSAGTGLTQFQVPLINNGTVDVQTATIRYDSQGKTFNDGCRFTGAGSNLIYDITVQWNGTVTAENLVLGSASGNLAGTGTLAGTMFWTAGTIASNASLTVATNGVLQFLGNTTKYIRGALTNEGLVLWSGTADLNVIGVVHNLPDGVFEARSDNILNWTSGTPVFINDGIFRKAQSSGITAIEVGFVNNGTMDAQTGTIRFDSQGKTFNDGCKFTGSGASLIYSAKATLVGTIFSENLSLGSASATLDGNGGVAGVMLWSAGTILSNASLTVASNGVLQLSGNTSKYIRGALTNAGQVVWGGTADLYVYGWVHNLPGGVFEAQNDNILNWASGTPVFINDGVFRKTQTAGLTTIQVSFVNNGTVDAQTGTIRWDLKDKTFNAGCRFIGTGTSLLYSSTNFLNGTIYSENLVLGGSSAVLSGAGSVDGSFTWNIGTLSPDVSFNVTTNGHLRLASSGTKILNGNITNSGVVTWTGSGTLTVRGAIQNRASGLFEIQNDEYLNWVSGSPVFVNEGTIRKTVATGPTICEIALVNNGTVDVQTGTFRFDLKPKTFNAGCRFTGAGSSLLYDCTNTLAGTIYSENLVLGGASAALSGAGSVNGSFTWNSGTLTPDISFNITTNGLLLLASGGTKNLNGTITNAGTVRWTGSGNLIVRGAIHNLPGSLFDAQNNEVLDFVSSTPVIVNEGTFRKSAGTLTTTCQIPFHNFGRVEVNSGTLYYYNTGVFTDHAGTIALGGGTFQNYQTLALAEGLLTGFGTLKPGSTAGPGLTSAATVAPATNGVLTIQGDFTQLLPGTVNFTLGGTAPGTNLSRLNITGDATLAGTIGVTLADGYLPSPGDTFNVMTYKNRTGDFACYNGFLFLGQNRRLLTQYSPTNLALVTVSMPDPTNVVARVTAQAPSALVCWPAEFVGYGLAWSTNLNATNWTVIPGVTNRYVETPMAPEKFFRLLSN